MTRPLIPAFTEEGLLYRPKFRWHNKYPVAGQWTERNQPTP
jgi:hypothetical protein